MERLCPECKGAGYHYRPSDRKASKLGFIECDKCHGHGTIELKQGVLGIEVVTKKPLSDRIDPILWAMIG